MPFYGPKFLGQSFVVNGCNTMTGAKAGVAARIEELEPRAVFVHCYRHTLNLGVSDTNILQL